MLTDYSTCALGGGEGWASEGSSAPCSRHGGCRRLRSGGDSSGKGVHQELGLLGSLGPTRPAWGQNPDAYSRQHLLWDQEQSETGCVLMGGDHDGDLRGRPTPRLLTRARILEQKRPHLSEPGRRRSHSSVAPRPAARRADRALASFKAQGAPSTPPQPHPTARPRPLMNMQVRG